MSPLSSSCDIKARSPVTDFSADLEEMNENYVSVNRPQIHFTSVTIRTYDCTIGDNPACKDGTPVSLDWSFTQRDPISLSEYESSRPPRRTRRQLAMSTITRRNLLVNHFGFSEKDVHKAERDVKIIRKKREQSKISSPGIGKMAKRMLKRTFSKEKLSEIKIGLVPSFGGIPIPVH